MKKFSALLLAAALLVVACKKDDGSVTEPDHDHDHEVELITTVQLGFTGPENEQNIYTFKFVDLDGPGGNPPTTDTIRLLAGKKYRGVVIFLNEAVNPPENINSEISEELDEHIICYSHNLTSLNVQRMDTDGTYEVGIDCNWHHTGLPENGTVTITLKHQPGVKDGTCAPGETDVEVTFPVVYQ